MTDENRDLPLAGQMLAKVDFQADDYNNPTHEVTDLADANVMTSKVKDPWPDGAMHKLVLDIDLPVKVLASTTEDHHHLFIDWELTWTQYARVLDVLADVGILEPGYVAASKKRGFTAVRLPWVKKEVKSD